MFKNASPRFLLFSDIGTVRSFWIEILLELSSESEIMSHDSAIPGTARGGSSGQQKTLESRLSCYVYDSIRANIGIFQLKPQCEGTGFEKKVNTNGQ